MDPREKCLKLADVLSLAAEKTCEIAMAAADGVGPQELVLAQQIDEIADKLRLLARGEPGQHQISDD